MPTLQYDLAIVGVANVDRALSGLEKRFVQHNARMAREVGGSRRAIRGTSPDADLARSFQQIARAGMSADRQRYAAQRREEANAQRERLRNVRDVERAEQRLQAQRSRALYQIAQQEARAATSAQREFRSRVGSVVGSLGNSFRGGVYGLGKAALTATGLGGGALIASRLGPSTSLEKEQRSLVVAGRGAGQAAPYSYEEIQQIVKNRSIATGQSQEQITAGLREYVSATGDLKGAVSQIDSFATTATAAEANVQDVAKAAAYLSTAMHISAKDMPQALSTLYFQGKKGAFELKDIAEAVPILGSQASTLGMGGLEGLKTLGGLAQIAQKGTGNPAEAQTALSNLFTQIVAKSGKLQSGEALGHRVQVFEHGDPTKRMLDIRTILADMIAGARGNVQKLEAVGEIRGSKALNPLVDAYRTASEGTHGTEAQKVAAGRNAVLAMIRDNADAAGTFKDVQRDAADVMKSTSVQLEILNSKLTAAVQEKLLPAFTRLEPQLEKLIPYAEKGIDALGRFAEYFADNPLKGLGEIVTAKIVTDLTAAGLQAAASAAVKDLFLSLTARFVGPGAGGLPGGIPATAGGGPLAVAGAALPAAASLLGVGYESYQLAREVSGGGRHGGGWQGVKDTVATVLNGPSQPLTPEQYDAVYGRSQQVVTTRPAVPPQQGSAPDRLNKAADRLIGAADKLSNAAERTGPSPIALNRGNSPSPVKP